MSRLSPDIFFSQLIVDYLNCAASATAGVPDNTTLPKVRIDSGVLRTLPGLVVSAHEVGKSTDAKKTMHIMVTLLFRLPKVGTDAASDEASLAVVTQRETISQWGNSVESRLKDGAGLSAFFATLDSTRTAGWTILKRRSSTCPPEEHDTQKESLTLFIATEWDILWLPDQFMN